MKTNAVDTTITQSTGLAQDAQSTANTALSNATQANSDLSQAKADLQSNIEQAKTDIAAAKTDISNTQSDLNQAKTGLQASISQNSSDISSAKSDLSQAKTDISSANSDIAQAKTDIANNKSGLATLKQTIDENSSAIANNSNAISLVKQTATQNSSDIANAKGNISSLKQTSDKISSTVAQTQQSLDNVGATNLVYNSEYDNGAEGWNMFGVGYLSAEALSIYNGSQSLGVNVSGKGAGSWTKFSESKYVAVPSTTVDNNTNIFSFAAMVRLFEHSSDAVTVLVLGFFDSDGNRIAFQNAYADSTQTDWQKVTFDGFACPANAVSVSIQYFVQGDTMHAVASQPIITQTSANVPYHADTANVKGDISTLQQTADKNSSAIEAANGNISSLQQTATQNSSDIATEKGDISSLKQTATQNTSDISSAKGDISTLKQTATENSSAIANNSNAISLVKQTATQNSSDIASAKGDISTLKQTATQNSSDIANAKGDISSLKQTASKNSSAISDANGNISSLQQTASKNSNAISDANGNISSLQQTSDKISSTVANTQQSLDNFGAPNLVYNSEYLDSAYGWNLFGIGHASGSLQSVYNASLGLEAFVSGKGTDTWTPFGESKHYDIRTFDIYKQFSFSAMVNIREHSPEASVLVTLAFFDSSGNRISWQDTLIHTGFCDIDSTTWIKASAEGIPYPGGAATVAIQYNVHGDSMTCAVSQPIITQTNTNVPYHADTANQATVVKQTADQWSVFASKNGIFTGIAVNSDGTINMNGAKVTVSGDMIVGGTLSSNSVSINGSTDKVDQTTGDVPYMPWKWDSSTFVINDGFISTSANNAVAPGQGFATNALGTYAPTYLKFTMWNPNNANDEWGRAYLDSGGLYVGLSSSQTIVNPGSVQTETVTANTEVEVGNITINSGHSIYSADNGDLYFRGKNDDRQIDIHAHALKSTSLLSQKTNISPLSPEEAMDALLNTDIYKYQYISDLQRGSNEKYASLVIDDVNATPQYKADKAFITPEKDARDDGIIANYSAQAIKYLYQKLSDQQTEIDELKQEIKQMKEEK